MPYISFSPILSHFLLLLFPSSALSWLFSSPLPPPPPVPGLLCCVCQAFLSWTAGFLSTRTESGRWAEKGQLRCSHRVANDLPMLPGVAKHNKIKGTLMENYFGGNGLFLWGGSKTMIMSCFFLIPAIKLIILTGIQVFVRPLFQCLSTNSLNRSFLIGVKMD